jgi:hypothetical protein
MTDDDPRGAALGLGCLVLSFASGAGVALLAMRLAGAWP